MPAPYNGRGLSYIALGDYENAFDDFNAALRLDPQNAEGWHNQALVYEHRGDRTRARNSYARAVALKPNYPAARSGLARVGSV